MHLRPRQTSSPSPDHRYRRNGCTRSSASRWCRGPFTRPPSTRRRRTRGLRQPELGTADPVPHLRHQRGESAWYSRISSTTRPVDVRSRIGGLRLLSSLIGTVDLSVSRAVRCASTGGHLISGIQAETCFDSAITPGAGPTPGRRPTSRLHDVQALGHRDVRVIAHRRRQHGSLRLPSPRSACAAQRYACSRPRN